MTAPCGESSTYDERRTQEYPELVVHDYAVMVEAALVGEASVAASKDTPKATDSSVYRVDMPGQVGGVAEGLGAARPGTREGAREAMVRLLVLSQRGGLQVGDPTGNAIMSHAA
ncbi:uncharacterized protein RAG0_12121 [Rhynchosporium agropyri]|uniref:Uncharacterized protein n=1 Tax=Rhynchosporium agropyri TaxID=914238 RepID=A0A1E1L775_9HELO|nr:uncharacterized protein RAG0_12121 [Rhynchosporium agropyri]